MIVYSEEDYEDIVDELKGIVQSQWDELGENQEEIELDVDYDYYTQVDAQHQLVMLTARDEGLIVGYSVLILYGHQHHKDKAFAYNDLIWVIKPYRNGRVGYRLIKLAETILQDYGIRYVTYNFKNRFNFGHGIERMGYQPVETVYGKLLGE